MRPLLRFVSPLGSLLFLSLALSAQCLAGLFPSNGPVGGEVDREKLRGQKPREGELQQLTQEAAKNPQDAAAHMKLGEALAASGNLEAAVREFRAAVRLQPENPAVHYSLGLVYLKMKNLEGAEAQMREALRLRPNYLPVRFTLGILLVSKKELDRAFSEFRELARFGGGDGARAFDLSSVLIPAEQYDFNHAKQDAKAHFYVGFVLQQQKDFDRASEEFREAARNDPDFALPHQALAMLYMSKGQVPDAVSENQIAIRLNPGTPNPHVMLGILYATQNNLDGAIAEFKEAMGIAPNLDQAHFNLANTYLRMQRVDDARAEYLQGLALNPRFSPAHGSLAMIYYLRGQHALAWQQVHEVQRLGGSVKPDFLEALGKAMSEPDAAQQFDEIPRLKQALEKHPGDARAHLQLGNALAKLDRLEEATTEYLAAIRLEPKFAESHLRLGELHAMSGKKTDALREWEEALRIRPDYAEAHFLLGRLYAQDPQTSDQAVEHYKAFLRNPPDTPDQAHMRASGYLGLARAYEGLGREKEALDNYEQALTQDSNSSVIWNNTAWLYATAKDQHLRNPQKALEYAKKAVEMGHGKEHRLLDTLAAAYSVNGQLDSAIETEREAISLDPNNQAYKDRLKNYEQAEQAGTNSR